MCRLLILMSFLILFSVSSPIVGQDLNKLQEMGKEADIKSFKALEYYMERDYERAARTYEEVISICDELKKMAGNNQDFDSKMDSIIIDKLVDSAECYQMMSNLEKARENYIRAGTMAEKYSDKKRKLKILCDLAMMARESSDFKQFIVYCAEVEKSLENVRDIEKLPLTEMISWAEIENRYRLLSIERSSLLYDMGKIDEALSCLNDKRLKETHRVLSSLFTPDTFQKLFDSVKKANPELIQDILNIIFINIKSEIYLTSFRGHYLRAKGEYREALASFDDMERFLKSVDISKLDGNYDVCISYLRELAGGAEPYMRPIVDSTATKLIKFKDEEINLEYRTFMAENGIRRAQTYKAMGEYGKADALFEAVFKEIEKLGNFGKTKIPLVVLEMGELQYAEGNYQKSLDYARQAEKSLVMAPLDFTTPWKTYTLFGKLYERQGELQEAGAAYKRAIDYIERLHSLLYIGRRREEFFGERIEPYEGIIRILVSMDKPVDALRYVEKAKARSLSEHFGATFLDSNIPPEARKKMLVSFHQLYRKLQESEDAEHANKTVALNKAPEIEENLKKMTGDLATLSSYKGLLDDYANFVCAATISAEDAQKLNDGESVVLEFFYDTSSPEKLQRAYLFVITSDTTNAMALTISPSEMEKEIRILRNKISRRDGSWSDEASLLYQQLIEPAEKYWTGKKRLIIVPHKVLHYLPFAALTGKGGRPLMADRSIVYTPSMTALKFCRDKHTIKGNNIVYYCLGNISIDGLSPLPGTLLEGQLLEKVYHGSTGIREKEFTKERVYCELKGRNIVHFATHGIIDADHPGNSGLVTSDGRLTVEDILDSRKFTLSSHIVALSACNTGLGKLFPGDEQEGLTRAFMFAGTPSVLSTLWSVSDDSTAKLMGYFYANLQRNMEKDEALRQAEIMLMKDFPHPYYWAPFILTGYWKN
jgi:CHAT domain-containing protein